MNEREFILAGNYALLDRLYARLEKAEARVRVLESEHAALAPEKRGPGFLPCTCSYEHWVAAPPTAIYVWVCRTCGGYMVPASHKDRLIVMGKT